MHKEAIRLLKEYNKWRRGKGKKYSQPGLPLNPTEIGNAIDYAVEQMAFVVAPDCLREIYLAAFATRERVKEYIRKVKKGKIEACDHMPLELAEQKLAALTASLSAVKKILNRIDHKEKAAK